MRIHLGILAAAGLAVLLAAGANAQDDNGGPPVNDETREQIKPTFGADPSDIRPHNDSDAATAAESVGARAFTTGNHIPFSRGTYGQEAGENRELLRHELSHTVQQQQSVATEAASSGGGEAEETGGAETRLPERLRHRDRATRDEDDDRRRSRADRPD